MSYLRRAIVENPKTTAAGLAMAAGLIYGSVQKPEMLTEPGFWCGIVTAAGMLLYAKPEAKQP
jgi:hypothetical protein